MPTVNLNKKILAKVVKDINAAKAHNDITESQFAAAVKVIEDYTNNVIAVAKKVVITPFGFVNKNNIHTDTYYRIGVSNATINLTKESPGNVIFKRVGDAYLAALEKATPIQIYLLVSIARNLVWGSNVIIINLKELSKDKKCSLRSLTSAIEFACQNRIIARTDKKNVYIINHNALFYGRYEDFVADYKRYYGDNTYPDFVNGKVVLSKNYII